MRAIGEPFRVPLHRLRMPKSIPAGMNLIRIAAIADTLLNGGEVHEPALVRLEGPGEWSITDGRHRYVASYVAGMPDLWCVEEA